MPKDPSYVYHPCQVRVIPMGGLYWDPRMSEAHNMSQLFLVKGQIMTGGAITKIAILDAFGNEYHIEPDRQVEWATTRPVASTKPLVDWETKLRTTHERLVKELLSNKYQELLLQAADDGWSSLEDHEQELIHTVQAQIDILEEILQINQFSNKSEQTKEKGQETLRPMLPPSTDKPQIKEQDLNVLEALAALIKKEYPTLTTSVGVRGKLLLVEEEGCETYFYIRLQTGGIITYKEDDAEYDIELGSDPERAFRQMKVDGCFDLVVGDKDNG